MPAHRLNLTGQRFGALTALDMVGTNSRKAVLWRCRCECGIERIIAAGELNAGQITHCGCRWGGNKNGPQSRKVRQVISVESPKISSIIDFYLRSYRNG